MMKMMVQFAATVLVLAMVVPSLTRDLAGFGEARVDGREDILAGDDVAFVGHSPSPRDVAPAPGQARIRIGRDGHFRTDAKLNYHFVPVMVDTGASSVALPRSVAERIGIRLRDRDFRHTARTANGETPMAVATLQSVEIGGVVVDNVEAAVLSDESLGGVLLGMSFLGRLRRFSVENGELVLVR